MIFDLVCYAIATVSVLAIVGSTRRNSPAPATREIDNTLSVIHAIGEALPENCFDDEPLEEGVFCCDASPEDAALVDAASEAIARYWASYATDNVVPFARPVRKSERFTLSYRTRDELRAACNSVGIQPRDMVNGKRKFWSIDRMLQELSLAGYEVVKAA